MAISEKQLKIKMRQTAELTVELIEIGRMDLADEFAGVCLKVQAALRGEGEG